MKTIVDVSDRCRTEQDMPNFTIGVGVLSVIAAALASDESGQQEN